MVTITDLKEKSKECDKLLFTIYITIKCQELNRDKLLNNMTNLAVDSFLFTKEELIIIKDWINNLINFRI